MKVSIFIDGKNFYSGWRTRAARAQLDHARMSRWLLERLGGTVLTACHYYTGIEPDGGSRSEAQQGLARYLEMLELLPGYFVHRFARRETSHVCPACGQEARFTQEKEVDTTMVADMLRLAAVGAFDAMVLVSGDSDHLPAIRGVRTLGKIAYVSSWGGSGMSRQLRKHAFDHVDLLDGLAQFTQTVSASSSREVSSSINSAAVPASESVAAMSLESDASQLVDLDFAVLLQVSLAQRYFERRPRGFLGINYFATRWQQEGFTTSQHERRRALDRLAKNGLVEKFDGDGALGLRITPRGRDVLEGAANQA